MILVSACLLGFKTKYNGGDNLHSLLCKYDERGVFLAVCPECLGDLPIPRLPAEIADGNGEDVWKGKAVVHNTEREDLTAAFRLGAERVWAMAEKFHIKYAVFKEKSPSCGCRQIYDGTFSGRKIAGPGVSAALLKGYGIKVFSEEEVTRELLEKILRA